MSDNDFEDDDYLDSEDSDLADEIFEKKNLDGFSKRRYLELLLDKKRLRSELSDLPSKKKSALKKNED